jgi:membrane carboxypeptidase/penicillin-binding protein
MRRRVQAADINPMKARDDQVRVLMKLLQLIGAAAFAGVLVGLLALPGVGSVGMAARDASGNFQSMPDDFSLTPPPERTTVYSADGQVIAQFYYHNRESVSLKQVAPIM